MLLNIVLVYIQIKIVWHTPEYHYINDQKFKPIFSVNLLNNYYTHVKYLASDYCDTASRNCKFRSEVSCSSIRHYLKHVFNPENREPNKWAYIIYVHTQLQLKAKLSTSSQPKNKYRKPSSFLKPTVPHTPLHLAQSSKHFPTCFFYFSFIIWCYYWNYDWLWM